ncbi:MAG: hypothetical protein ACKOA9_10335 [Actinomycetota bacterium]
MLLVAFRRQQQVMVDSWTAWLDARCARDPGLRYYEVPTIGVLWSPMRPFIDGGMARAIPDRTVRARTLTAYTDVQRVRAALGLVSTGTIAVVLVDRAGCVRWQGRGGFSERTAAELDTALRGAAGPDPDRPLT